MMTFLAGLSPQVSITDVAALFAVYVLGVISTVVAPGIWAACVALWLRLKAWVLQWVQRQRTAVAAAPAEMSEELKVFLRREIAAAVRDISLSSAVASAISAPAELLVKPMQPGGGQGSITAAANDPAALPGGVVGTKF